MSLHKFIFDFVLQGLLIIVLAIGVYRFKNLSKELRLIVYFVLIGTFTEFFLDFYKVNVASNTMPIGHFYFTVSILILCFFYRIVLRGYIKTWIIDVLMLLYLMYSIINVLFIQSIYDFPSLLGALGAMILIFFSLSLFLRIMSEAKIQKLRREPMVWVNIGVLIYYTGSFFYFITFNLQVANTYEFLRVQVGYFIAILNALLYVFVALSFLLAVKNKNLI